VGAERACYCVDLRQVLGDPDRAPTAAIHRHGDVEQGLPDRAAAPSALACVAAKGRGDLRAIGVVLDPGQAIEGDG
jgi:hypothetical protein